MTTRSALRCIALAAVLAVSPDVWAQCEGRATAMTVDTRHERCVSPSGALTWTLNIICMDACEQPWTSTSRSGSADGACDIFTGNFCSPPYIRESYTNGMYAETSAYNQTLFAGCKDAEPSISQGNCPCAPSCQQDTGSGGQCDTTSGGVRDDIGTTSTGDPEGCCYSQCSPILINLDGDSFRLSGSEPPVEFDIDADGDLDAISWTRFGGDEAFLALDRDGNGIIDSGAELFGAATAQPPSDDPNGFVALAVFDGSDFGGDGDGRITAADAWFSRLLLWTDADRDGLSSPDELQPLAGSGVEEIMLDYVISERRDRWDNLFRWTSRAQTFEGRPLTVSDVVFVPAGSPTRSP